MFQIYFNEAIRRGYDPAEAFFAATLAVFSCSMP